jgi:hypothetical protein
LIGPSSLHPYASAVMRPVHDEDQAKRVGSSVELKQVHSQDDDDVVEPIFEDDDEDLEDTVAAAHHRFEDDDETISLLSASPPSSVIAEQGVSQVLRSMRVGGSSFSPLRMAHLL